MKRKLTAIKNEEEKKERKKFNFQAHCREIDS
jgi:hypothetical protein